VSTSLDDHIYLFDTNTNFEKYYSYGTGRNVLNTTTTTSSSRTSSSTTNTTTPSTTTSAQSRTDSSPMSLIEILQSSESTSSPRSTIENNNNSNDNNSNNNNDNNSPLVANETKIESVNTPKKSCAVCGLEGHLLRCSRCKSCWYCTKEHQRDDWPTHKLTCHAQAERKEPIIVVQKPPSFKVKYQGHISRRTIKGVNFYGPNSEYVISGSDDSNIYIYEKESSELLRVLQGHEKEVNCITGHPSSPIIASSGVDKVVKIWNNKGEYPTEEVRKKRSKIMEDCVQTNESIQSNPRENIAECILQ
jgi:WD40 repeat protein